MRVWEISDPLLVFKQTHALLVAFAYTQSLGMLIRRTISSLNTFTRIERHTHIHPQADLNDGKATTGTTFVLASAYPPECNYLQQLLMRLFVPQLS